jgi:hypothetical protein
MIPFKLIYELAYTGNIGIQELMMFYQDASPRQIELLEDLLKREKISKAVKLLYLVTGIKLHEDFKGGGTEAPGSYAKGFPSVYKIDHRDVPSIDKTVWMIAYPGKYEMVKWYTADDEDPSLHPQELSGNLLGVTGKTESGRMVKMKFSKDDRSDKLCPYDPDTWEPVNISQGGSRSEGEVLEARKIPNTPPGYRDVEVDIISLRGEPAVVYHDTNKRITWRAGGFDTTKLAQKLLNAYEMGSDVYPIDDLITRSNAPKGSGYILHIMNVKI